MKGPRKVRTFEVTLRRDVQQISIVRVQASTAQEAIDVAESASEEDASWNHEKHLGVHRPAVHALPWKPKRKAKP